MIEDEPTEELLLRLVDLTVAHAEVNDSIKLLDSVSERLIDSISTEHRSCAFFDLCKMRYEICLEREAVKVELMRRLKNEG